MAIGGFGGALLAGAAGLGDAIEKARRDKIAQQDAQARLQLLQAQLQNYGPQNFQQLEPLTDPFAPVGGPQSSSVGGAASLGPPMSNYTPGKGFGFSDIRDLALKAGYSPQSATTQAAIDMGESGGNPRAYNPNDPGGSYGLGQVNAKAHPDMRMTFDPTENMRQQFQISKGGTDFTPWSVYKSGAYQRYLPQGGTQPVNAAGMSPPDTSPQARAQGAQALGIPPEGSVQQAQYSPQEMQPIQQLNQQLQAADRQLTTNFTQRMQQARTPQERAFLQQDLVRKRQDLMTLYNTQKQQIVQGQQTEKQERFRRETMEKEQRLIDQRETNLENRKLQEPVTIDLQDAEGKSLGKARGVQGTDKWTTITGKPLSPEQQEALERGQISKFGSKIDASANKQSIESVAQMISKYNMAPISGWAMRGPWGQAVMARVNQLNPDYDQTKYQAKVRGEIAFTTGNQSNAVRSFNTSLDHLAVLDDYANALDNGAPRILNEAKQRFNKEFGFEAPVDFDAIKTIVGSEVTKAVQGGVGALADREEIRLAFDRANSPLQLQGVAQALKRLMAGQLNNFQRQAINAGISEADFQKGLSDNAKSELAKLTPQSGASAAGVNVPDEAAQMLKDDPSDERRQQFDEIFERGTAAKVLGQ